MSMQTDGNRARSPQRGPQFGHLIVLFFTMAQKPFKGARRHFPINGAGPTAHPRIKTGKGNLTAGSHTAHTERKFKLHCRLRGGIGNI